MEKIDKSTFGLTIIDMQKNYLASIPIKEKRILIQRHIDLIEKLKEKDIPILTLEMLGKEKTRIEIREKLPKYEELNFKKKNLGGYLLNDKYQEKVKELGILNMLYCGLFENYCVGYTGIEGKSLLGIQPLFAQDLTRPQKLENEKEYNKIENMRSEMQKAGTLVKSYKTILDLLE